MNNLIKYAAAQRAIKLMQQGGSQGRRFFKDLMKRQKGLNDFGPQRQMEMLRDLGGKFDPSLGSGGTMAAYRGDVVRTLKQLLRQGRSYADDSMHMNSTIPKLVDRIERSYNPPKGGTDLMHNRRGQMGDADEHAFVLRRDQHHLRENAARMDDLLRRISLNNIY